MRTQASVARHPIHPMLVVFPIGLFIAALVFDIAALVKGGTVWRLLAFYDIALGIIGGLAAAIPGFVDYLSLRGQVRRTATWHMALNLGLVALFAVNFALRTRWGQQWVPAGSSLPPALTIIGVIVMAVSGWLGGHLVYVDGVGVQDETALRAAEIGRRRAA